MTFACFDFETANNYRTSACQLAISIVEGHQITQTRSWMIRPEPFEFGYFEVLKHGITAAAVEHCPRFCDVWQEIEQCLRGRVLVAHNASFDMSVLRRTLAHYELQSAEFPYLCTLQISRQLWSLPSHNLAFLSGHFGIPLQHHDAESDSIACAEILIRALQETNCTDPDEFISSLSMEFGLSTSRDYCTPLRRVGPAESISISEYLGGELENLDGITVSTTGEFGNGITRRMLQEIVERAGGIFHPIPKKDTKWFVINDSQVRELGRGASLTQKHQRALKMIEQGIGLEIISSAEFLQRISKHDD